MYNYLKEAKLTYAVKPNQFIKFLVDSATEMKVKCTNKASVEWSKPLVMFHDKLQETLAERDLYMPTDIMSLDSKSEEDEQSLISFM